MRVEAIKEIPQKLVTGVRDLVRGYTNADLQSTRRIFLGKINSDDRARFISAQSERLYFLSIGGTLSPYIPRDPSIIPSISYIRGIENYKAAIQRLHNLSEEEINQQLTQLAGAKLELWHQPPT